MHAAVIMALLLGSMNRQVEGTLMRVDPGSPPSLLVNVSRQFQTFALSPRAVAERESRSSSSKPVVVRIPASDLTPGELVRLDLDSRGNVKRALAIAVVETMTVRSVNGAVVVLEDGTTLTIGTTLRFVDAKSRSAPAAGERVLLFRHPQTRNIYRLSAS